MRGVRCQLNHLFALLYNLLKMRTERISDLPLEEDVVFTTLRPARLDEFIGQNEIKEKLRIYIAATQRRNEPLDHVMLHSPPGLGKTTLARIIATEMGVSVRVSSGRGDPLSSNGGLQDRYYSR